MLSSCGHEAYDDQDNWLDYFLIEDIDTEPEAGARETKMGLFARMLKQIEAHATAKEVARGQPYLSLSEN